jgi:hypothetical protein
MHPAFRVTFFALLTGATLATPATAQSKVRWNARLAGDFGGEKVLQFQYSDGSTPDVPAGAGLTVTAGAVLEAYKSERQAVEAQLNVGLKYRTIPPATNQTANWLRFPVEALLLYRTPVNLRIGGGATFHLANTLVASGDVVNDRVTFKPTPGAVLQAEYMFRNTSLDLRYTVLNYEIESGGSGEVNANSLGIGMSFWFGGQAAGAR